MAEEYIFSVQGLSVGYRGVPLIRDMEVHIRRGQILTLIGPNGAGKSTILKTITRQLAPIAGTVLIEKKDLSAYRPADLARQVAVVLTERVQPEMMTCFDVAAMGRYPYTGRFGSLTPRDRELVHQALSRVRAEDIADRDFSQISDGQHQRVLLARALCQEPDILVLDEPTSFLDIRHKIDLLDILLEESRERGLTVILSLHEIDLAEKIADRVLCVKGDRMYAQGSPEEIFTQDTIARLYDIRQGNYLVSRGSVELARAEGTPKVFVVGGAGYGLPFYRKLQKMRVPFAAGILFDNDAEYEVASALACQVISVPAFSPIGEETLEQAKALLSVCLMVADAGTPIRDMNRANADLIQFARDRGIPIITATAELEASHEAHGY